MNEIQRIAYLDALGIDSYISRGQLPAAAPSRRLRVVRPVQATPVAAETAVPDQNRKESTAPGQSGSARPGASPARAAQALLTAEPASRQAGIDRTHTGAAQAEAASEPDSESMPMFSVAACFLAGYCWLDEVPRARELGDDYLPLLQGICAALGWEADAPVLERFNWPMHHNRQLDQGQETARHGFEGFIRARLEQHPVRGIILLGEPEGGWMAPGLFSGLEVHTTISAWKILKHPQLKKDAWRDLKRLSKARD